MKRQIGNIDAAPQAQDDEPQKKHRNGQSDDMIPEKLHQLIFSELSNARLERRDFHFTRQAKMEMVREFGLDVVCATLLRAIRQTGTPVAEPYDPDKDLSPYVRSVQAAAVQLSR
jgi:hypothetical protein